MPPGISSVQFHIYRSSHPEVFFEKGVLRIFRQVAGKQVCKGMTSTLLKSHFPMGSAEEGLFLENISRELLLYIVLNIKVINLDIVTRKNIVWKLARGYCLCRCKTFSLVPDPAEGTNVLTKSAVHHLYHLKSNNAIGQRKTTNANSFIHDWFCLLILPNSNDLLYILYNYCTNWLRVISCKEKINRLLVVMHHEIIHEFISSRFLKRNLQCQNKKMGRRTYEHLFFFHETMF